MNRLLSLWNNRPIRAKIGIILVSMVVITVVVALLTSAIVGIAGRRTRQGAATTVEMRSLAQDIELETEQLQRLQTALAQDYTRPDFNPTTTSFDDDYSETLTDILFNDLPRFQDLTLGLATAQERPALTTEFRSFQQYVEDASDNFDQTFDLVNQLTNPTTGAQIRLDQQGDQLQALTVDTGSSDLNSQIALIRGLEFTMVQTGSKQAQLDLRDTVQSFRIAYVALDPNNTDEALEAISAYLTTVDEVALLLTKLDNANRAGLRNLDFAGGSASRLANIATDQASRQVATIESLTASIFIPLLVGAGIQLLVLAGLMFFFGRSILDSVNRLLSTTRRFEEGNFSARVEIGGEDEFNQLGASFNSMAAQLGDLVGGLEARVAERTRDLNITAEIGQTVLAVRDPRDLMQEVVELIRQRFDFYHVQIFVLDDDGVHARLTASTGAVGRELLARRHTLAVGSQSVIGQVTATATPVIASDTDTNAVHRRNELLPDTRSEMALPMRIGDRVIGALDVQSVAPNAFDQDTVAVFQIMSDQLAVALENARLHYQLGLAEEELNSMERRITSDAWRTYQRGRDPNAPLGYEMQGEVLLPQRGGLPIPVRQAIEDGRLVAQENGESDIQIALPIKVRGEVIGAFGFGGDALRELTDEDIALVEAVIDRVGLALENMRLVEQTSRRAEYEQIVNEITAKIVGSTDVNYILQTTVRELGRALRAPQTSVQLRREPMELRDE